MRISYRDADPYRKNDPLLIDDNILQQDLMGIF